MAEAANTHLEVVTSEDVETRQREVATITEMYHTASLYHDDVIDGAETRRGLASANHLWGAKGSIMGGNYVIATSNALLGSLRDPQVSCKSFLRSCRYVMGLANLKLGFFSWLEN